jgi:aspartate/methionine/tyrosine aminotransferase
MGFFSDESMEINRLERTRREVAAAGGYSDLTISNPTQQGFLFPPAILRTAAERYWQHRRYTPDAHGLVEAREAIIAYYQSRAGQFCPGREDIFITASTSEAYALLFSLLTEPGDNVLAPDITYPLFEYLAAIHHVELRPYHLCDKPDWAIDGASLTAARDDRTRAVLVISPHNPTGMVVDRPMPAFTKIGCPVVCDEVFAEFTVAAREIVPFAALHPEVPVFHLQGISKMLALPDLKLGWIAMNGPASAEHGKRLALLNDTFLGCSTLIQTMLPVLLQEGRTFAQNMYRQVRENAELACQELGACEGVRVLLPQGGYYLFPQVATEDEEELTINLLREGVLVYPGYFYAHTERPLDKAHIMLSCLAQAAPWREGISRLVAGLQKLSSHERMVAQKSCKKFKFHK